MARRNLIAGGWAAYRRLFLRAGTGKREHDAARQAFYAGAATLFESIIRAVGEGDEPTDEDYQLMNDLQDELAEFGKDLDDKYLRRFLREAFERRGKVH